MKTTIEATSIDGHHSLSIEIGGTEWGDNIVITKKSTIGGLDPMEALRPGYVAPPKEEVVGSIDFNLDAETARSISFALGELAKTLGRK